MNYPQYTEPARKSKRSRAWMVIVPLCVFAITLAMLVSRHLSPEAQAVLAGAVCGVVVAIPTSAVITIITVKSRQREAKESPAPAPYPAPYDYRGQPPLVIQTVPAPQPTWPSAPVEWNQRPPRRFTQIGGTSAPGNPIDADLDD
jgi:flagellar basal body-associated protein FliL